MKLLSLWEPWASLMAIGAKRIETRSWSTGYRGWLAIHAAKRWTKNEIFFSQFGPCAAALGANWEPALGGIVAVVKLIDCTRIERCLCSSRKTDGDALDWNIDLNPTPCTSCQDIGCHPRGLDLAYPESEFGNYDEGRFAWFTDNLFRLPEPIPFKGKQGLIEVPEEILNQIRQQWRKAA